MQRLRVLKPLMDSKCMPKQAFFVKRGQDVVCNTFDWCQTVGLVSMIAHCGGCQAEYQDSEFR